MIAGWMYILKVSRNSILLANWSPLRRDDSSSRTSKLTMSFSLQVLIRWQKNKSTLNLHTMLLSWFIQRSHVLLMLKFDSHRFSISFRALSQHHWQRRNLIYQSVRVSDQITHHLRRDCISISKRKESECFIWRTAVLISQRIKNCLRK